MILPRNATADPESYQPFATVQIENVDEKYFKLSIFIPLLENNVSLSGTLNESIPLYAEEGVGLH